MLLIAVVTARSIEKMPTNSNRKQSTLLHGLIVLAQSICTHLAKTETSRTLFPFHASVFVWSFPQINSIEVV